VMPHCADYLHYLDSRYPDAEAIVSPRAYYFWEAAYTASDEPRCSFSFRHNEAWRDSKRKLRECLNGRIDYISLPQMYSGGFHRRSLVQRVIRLQGGCYFRSVTPDAYSAVMAVIHTYRYLEVGVPLTWVGTSPQFNHGGVVQISKDRAKDFYGMHSDDSLSMNPCLGKYCSKWPFLLHFYEAYIAAVPFVNPSELSINRINNIYLKCAAQLLLKGDREAGLGLANSLGIAPFGYLLVWLTAISIKWRSGYRKIFRLVVSSFCSVSSSILHPRAARKSFIQIIAHTSQGNECLNILSSDHIVSKAFDQYFQAAERSLH